MKLFPKAILRLPSEQERSIGGDGYDTRGSRGLMLAGTVGDMKEEPVRNHVSTVGSGPGLSTHTPKPQTMCGYSESAEHLLL